MAAPGRFLELAGNLTEVRQRIAEACAAAGRDPAGVQLIGVTKFFPASDAAALVDLGLADLGESRDQEASAKARELTGLTAGPVRWHFIGRLQTNKARSVARYADVVHSVDRLELVDALGRGVLTAGRTTLDALIQVSLDDDTERGGSSAKAVPELATAIAGQPGLRLAGVMAVAPMSGDLDQHFARLHEVSAELRREYPDADVISAGMSGDLEAAIRHGATHVRVGTALLGRRSATIR
jgi:pyridoxal phosphate enzyme (YggS family)